MSMLVALIACSMQGQALSLPKVVYVADAKVKYKNVITMQGDQEIVITILDTHTVVKTSTDGMAEIKIVTDSIKVKASQKQPPPMFLYPRTETRDPWHRHVIGGSAGARVPGSVNTWAFADILPPNQVIGPNGTPVEFLLAKGPDTYVGGTWWFRRGDKDLVELLFRGAITIEQREPIKVEYLVLMDSKTGALKKISTTSSALVTNDGGRIAIQRSVKLKAETEVIQP